MDVRPANEERRPWAADGRDWATVKNGNGQVREDSGAENDEENAFDDGGEWAGRQPWLRTFVEGVSRLFVKGDESPVDDEPVHSGLLESQRVVLEEIRRQREVQPDGPGKKEDPGAGRRSARTVRAFLADAIDHCSAIARTKTAGHGINLSLTRDLAIAVASVRFLEAEEGQLEDFLEMRAFRRLRRRVAHLILTRHALGECPADPLEAGRSELKRIGAALKTARAQADAWLKTTLPQDGEGRAVGTIDQIAEVHREARYQLGRCTHVAKALLAGLHPDDWRNGDLDPKIQQLAEALFGADHPLACAMGEERRDLLAMLAEASEGHGPLIQHLAKTAEETEALISSRDQEIDSLGMALDAARVGNHVTARSILVGLKRAYGDLDYGAVESECRKWFADIVDFEKVWRALKSAVTRDDNGRMACDAMSRMGGVMARRARIERMLHPIAGTEAEREIRGRMAEIEAEMPALVARWGEGARRYKSARLIMAVGAVAALLFVGAGATWLVRLAGQRLPAWMQGWGATAVPSPENDPAGHPGSCWTNSLGMVFISISKDPGVPMPCIWETRLRDYRVFADAAKRPLREVSFEQTADHPVVRVTPDDAQAFCEWLTNIEQQSGLLHRSYLYRLPTDVELGMAAMPDQGKPSSPLLNLSGADGGSLPWGNTWPPPFGSGNFGAALRSDNFACTSPVGSFGPNSKGLYDVVGNVWEWCASQPGGVKLEGTLGKATKSLFLPGGNPVVWAVRGGSFSSTEAVHLVLPHSIQNASATYGVDCGFRVVLAKRE